MRLLLALFGVLVVIVAVLFGFAAGEVDRIGADPEVKKRREAEEQERERQREWRKKASKDR